MSKKRIKPSQRPKKRYVATKITTKTTLPSKWGMHFLHELEEKLGVLNTAKAGLKLLDTTRKGHCILRVDHTETKTVLATLATIQRINKTPIEAIQTLKTTGILRKARTKLKAQKQEERKQLR